MFFKVKNPHFWEAIFDPEHRQSINLCQNLQGNAHEAPTKQWYNYGVGKNKCFQHKSFLKVETHLYQVLGMLQISHREHQLGGDKA